MRPITVLRRTVLPTRAGLRFWPRWRCRGAREPDAATLPPGFQESIVFSGLTNPTVVRFSPDGRVFVAEKSGLIKVFDNLTDPTPTVFADLSTNVHNFWDRGLLGIALDPGFPATPYVYVLYAHDAAIGGAAPRWGTPGRPLRPLPDTARRHGRRLRRLGTPLPAAGGRQHDDRHRAGADRGLVPAVSEPLGRQPRVRCRRRALRQRRRRRQLQLRRLGPGREPAQPVRRPARRPRLDPGAADRGGRCAAQPGPADARATRRRSTAPSCASTPRPARGCPTTRSRSAPTRTRAGSSRTASGTRSGSGSGRARARSGSATSAGTPGRRSTASIRPAPVDNFGWPCYEGAGRQSGYDGANLNICENLYAAGAGAVTAPVLRLEPLRHGRPRRDLPDRRLLRRGHGVLRRRQLPRLRRRALLRRLLP